MERSALPFVFKEAAMRRTSALVFLASAAASLVLAGTAVAATFVDSPRLTRQGIVVAGRSISANVNVHSKFTSISSVCFFVAFQDDLLDPGEIISFSFRGNVPVFGQENIFDEPLGSFATCLLSGLHDQDIAPFLDGKERLILSMSSGSVEFAGLQVIVDGVPG
jgi:hypothetical protein